ncbi:MAG: prolipoprotein diacylglyceryl transferase [Bacteroidetes bacterium]|nr:prolipoprotein diacylglyceryl transferase [Bacteroidota bacterium]
MYPTLYHFLLDTFGIHANGLQIVNTFGLFVALAIAAAFITMQAEMKRRTGLGQFAGVSYQVTVGKPYPVSDYLLNGGLAFLFGYKIIYLITNAGEGFSPQEHIVTGEGSWLWGILFAVAVLLWRYRTDKKQRLPEPKVIHKNTDSGFHMGNITTIALISGFFGAKLFHLLEDPSGLTLSNFVGEFFSSGGWTFYGGLICGAAGVLIYCRRKKLNLLYILDSGGPSMMVAYGIGRFGCHFSGDGDWGLANTHAKPFSWLPDWAWSYTYPHNVLGMGNSAPDGMKQIPGYTGDFSYELIVPVYPTPLYEALMGLILFYILWRVLRKRVSTPGNMFAWYMVFAGLERFTIEAIREHGTSLYRLGGLVFSQAQMISLLLLALGVLWLTIGGKKLGNRLVKPAG